MDTFVIDLSEVTHPDVSTVDAMASLHVIARRFGCATRFRHASGRLLELVDLLGLAEVLSVEPVGESE